MGRESTFSRLDFRPKFIGLIVVLMILAFIWESPQMGRVLTLAIVMGCLAAGVSIQHIRLVVTLMLPFYGLLLITHGFFNVEQVGALTGRPELTPYSPSPKKVAGSSNTARNGQVAGAGSGSPVQGLLGHFERTYLHESDLRPLDHAVFAVFALMPTVAMVVYCWLGIGRFAAPI